MSGSKRTFDIREARSAADYAAFGRLIEDYVGWCRKRYAADPGFVDMTFGHQSLDRELASLAETFGPPKGRTLIAADGAETIGAVAYRRLSADICEMKRMYVPQRHGGRGAGRALCAALCDLARADGFTLMRLDTTRDMTEAIALYRSAGFVDCEPYNEYPERLRPMMLFMEKRLGEKPLRETS